jgi:hypothetical protein
MGGGHEWNQNQLTSLAFVYISVGKKNLMDPALITLENYFEWLKDFSRSRVK